MKGLLTDIRKTQLEILNAKRKSETANYVRVGQKERQGYVKLLKTWFKEEKAYLQQLRQLLTQTTNSTAIQDAVVRWIYGLQQDDVHETCMAGAKNGHPLEKEFQYSLRNALRHRFPHAEITLEPEKADGRLDIRFVDPVEGTHIIELKGWWNQRKEEVAEQLCSYMTDFEHSGHIVMINHLKTEPITAAYQDMVIQPGAKYIDGSWKEHPVSKTGFCYFHSRHQFSVSERTLFHYVLDVHASNPTPKKPAGKRIRKSK
jgi:hypothetical protein